MTSQIADISTDQPFAQVDNNENMKAPNKCALARGIDQILVVSRTKD